MSWIRDFFRRHEKKQDAKLTDLGIFTIHDERLNKRVELFTLFHEKIEAYRKIKGPPEKQLGEVENIVNELNKMLHAMSVPYGRAGDTSWYAKAMSGWSTIHSRMLDMISSTAKLMKGSRYGTSTIVSKTECLSKLKHFLETFYIKYAILIMEVSWMRQDVSPSWSITVQQQAPMPYTGPPVRVEDTGAPGRRIIREESARVERRDSESA